MSLINLTRSLKLTKSVKILEKTSKCAKNSILLKQLQRSYSVQPPDWLGGKDMFEFSGQYDFPEHSESFEDRMKGWGDY